MWISLFTSILLYIPLFFWGRGNITIGDKFWSFKIHRRQRNDDDGLRRHALAMIAYVQSNLSLSLNRDSRYRPTHQLSARVRYSNSSAQRRSLARVRAGEPRWEQSCPGNGARRGHGRLPLERVRQCRALSLYAPEPAAVQGRRRQRLEWEHGASVRRGDRLDRG